MDRSKSVAVVGAGKIGELITALLAPRYDVTVYDQDFKRAKLVAGKTAKAAKANASRVEALARQLKGKTLVINACPWFMNVHVARAAAKAHASYIDLSEDVETGEVLSAAKVDGKKNDVFALQDKLADEASRSMALVAARMRP